MLAYALASKPCSEATNIGDGLSLLAVFGWILVNYYSNGGGIRLSLVTELNQNK